MFWLVKAGFYPQSYILYENHYDYSAYCFSTGTHFLSDRILCSIDNLVEKAPIIKETHIPN